MTPFERPQTTREQSSLHGTKSEENGAHKTELRVQGSASAAPSRPSDRQPPSQESLMQVFGHMCDGPGITPGAR